MASRELSQAMQDEGFIDGGVDGRLQPSGDLRYRGLAITLIPDGGGHAIQTVGAVAL
jgi:hypothetical protein